MKKDNILKYSDVSMYIDQYKYTYFASSRKELIKAVSPYSSPKVSIMYQEKKDGSSVRVGYVIGDHWLTEYKRVERAIK